jgi:hypothetical protein
MALTLFFTMTLPFLPPILLYFYTSILHLFATSIYSSSLLLAKPKMSRKDIAYFQSSRPKGPRRILPPTSWISWKSWNSLAVDLLNVPKEVNTHDVYDAFSKEGNIMYIDLWENSKGEPDSKGRVRFRLVSSCDFVLWVKPASNK